MESVARSVFKKHTEILKSSGVFDDVDQYKLEASIVDGKFTRMLETIGKLQKMNLLELQKITKYLQDPYEDIMHAHIGLLIEHEVKLTHADNIKLLISMVLARQHIAYNVDARYLTHQLIQLSGVDKTQPDEELVDYYTRTRLQCTSGSMFSIATILSLSKDKISEIEDGGKLALVRSAVGPHIQWGVWSNGVLHLQESTVLGVNSAIIAGEKQLDEYHIQQIIDAREALIKYEANEDWIDVTKFYSKNIPDIDMEIIKGDLYMPSDNVSGDENDSKLKPQSQVSIGRSAWRMAKPVSRGRLGGD